MSVAEVIPLRSETFVVKKRGRAKNLYPKDRRTTRPFRLWLTQDHGTPDEKRGREVRWKNYAFSWSAIEGGWAELKWLKSGQAIEIFNKRTSLHIATFARLKGGHTYEWVHPDYNIRFDRKTHKPKK